MNTESLSEGNEGAKDNKWRVWFMNSKLNFVEFCFYILQKIMHNFTPKEP